MHFRLFSYVFSNTVIRTSDIRSQASEISDTWLLLSDFFYYYYTQQSNDDPSFVYNYISLLFRTKNGFFNMNSNFLSSLYSSND